MGGNGKNQNGEGFNIGSILEVLRGNSDGNGGGLDGEGILNTLGIDKDNLNISGKFGMNTGKIDVGGVIEALGIDKNEIDFGGILKATGGWWW